MSDLGGRVQFRNPGVTTILRESAGAAGGDADFDFNGPGLAAAVASLGNFFARTDRSSGSTSDATASLPDRLPTEGIGAEAALSMMAEPFLAGSRALRDPGFVAHMDPPTPWMTWAATMWTSSQNQNLLHPDTGAMARDLERIALSWVAPSFGMDGGHMVPGSSIANLTAIWAARETKRVREVVCSEAAHLSVRKAAAILGLPCRVIPCRPDQTIDTSRLGDLRQSALVLNAGTVATGVVDLLDAGLDAAWTHVDAAWAGPLRFSPRYASLLHGVETADSVSVSAHKWLFQPKESAFVLFSDTAQAHASISFGGGYLAVPNIGVQGSHGAAAVPLLVTLLAWGQVGLAQRINRCMAIADALAELIMDHDDVLELWAPPTTGVVVWRPRGTAALAVRDSLRSSFASVTELAGERWLRSVAANPNADPRILVDEVVSHLTPKGARR